MSLLSSATLLDDIDNQPLFATEQSQPNSMTAKRRQRNMPLPPRNRTQKNSQKVDNMLSSIHSSMYDDSEQLSEFTPLAPPQPAHRPLTYPPIVPVASNESVSKPGDDRRTSLEYPAAPNGGDNSNNRLDENFMTEQQTQDYYRRVMPSYKAPPPSMMSSNNVGPSTEKLNYIINLLELQQDQRTNHVTEDVILFGFLGVFVIFIADSFVKVGKYVR